MSLTLNEEQRLLSETAREFLGANAPVSALRALRANGVQASAFAYIAATQGFDAVATRLGGGRIHHAMRTIAQLRKAFDMMCERALSRVTQAQYAALMKVLRRVCRDELWGLCSRPVKVGSFAQVCQALVHCHTLGDALRTAFRFYHLMLQDFVPRLQVRGNTARVVMVTLRERDPLLAYAERSFCFLGYGVMSWLVSRRIPLSCVFYPPGTDMPYGTEAERLFQAPVSHAQPRMGFEFDASWLSLPIVQNPQSLQEFMAQVPKVLVVKYRHQASLSERIRRMLRGLHRARAA